MVLVLLVLLVVDVLVVVELVVWEEQPPAIHTSEGYNVPPTKDPVQKSTGSVVNHELEAHVPSGNWQQFPGTAGGGTQVPSPEQTVPAAPAVSPAAQASAVWWQNGEKPDALKLQQTSTPRVVVVVLTVGVVVLVLDVVVTSPGSVHSQVPPTSLQMGASGGHCPEHSGEL